MKIRKQKNKKNKLLTFFKTNWVYFVLIFCTITVLVTLCLYLLTNNSIPSWKELFNISDTEQHLDTNNVSNIFSLNKVCCYSNVIATNNSESKAMWNLNISQYTDICLFLKINNENNELIQDMLEERNITDSNYTLVERTDKNTVSEVYIDNINFSNIDSGNLSLRYNNFFEFGKFDEASLSNNIIQENKISFKVVPYTNNLAVKNNFSEPTIDDNFVLPISLRYLNYNFKTNHLITNIKEPLSFDGSLLKRSSISIVSIKNTISFDIHIINKLGEEYIYPFTLELPLQNKNNTKNIYDGSYTDENTYTNCYFYLKNN